MERSVGPSLQVWFRPLRPPWYLGPGWAAIGGGLAAGALSPGGLKPALQTAAPAQVLTLLLAWCLADLLLGTIWELGVGTSPVWEGEQGTTAVAGVQRGIWFRLLRDLRPEDAAPPTCETTRLCPSPLQRQGATVGKDRGLPLIILPYTQPGSLGWRLAGWLGRLRSLWRADFRPEMGHAFVTLVVGLGAALATGAALGRVVMALVALSAVLSWLVARLQEAAASTTRSGTATLRGLGEFGIPWLIGCLAFGPLPWPAVALGVCYTIVYVGMLQQPSRFRLVGGGQAAAVWLLVGLRQPIAATVVAVMLIAQWRLHTCGRDNAAHAAGLRACQPLILLSLVDAALAAGL